MNDFEILIEWFGFSAENTLAIIENGGLTHYIDFEDVARKYAEENVETKTKEERISIGKMIVEKDNRFLIVDGKIFSVDPELI